MLSTRLAQARAGRFSIAPQRRCSTGLFSGGRSVGRVLSTHDSDQEIIRIGQRTRTTVRALRKLGGTSSSTSSRWRATRSAIAVVIPRSSRTVALEIEWNNRIPLIGYPWKIQATACGRAISLNIIVTRRNAARCPELRWSLPSIST